ncbi:alpha-ketoglutarate-dependent dioxygenase AlkB [Euzebya tangerina]|uniref:alpha-ketoglutarate-dependent dioxygenase AlkB n=1 Tax=Euzebya tangerina TaxID=591198 RepID=UPI000E316C1C|nr:alpha-ketoglutarate-dependent dioxygenase AlkB [Euzebya tangerina]
MAPTLAPSRQGSLFDAGHAPTHDPSFASLRREQLTRGAWVDIARGWALGHDALFEQVLDAADWAVHRREMFEQMVDQPRLSTSWVGEELPPGLAVIRQMATDLSLRYGARLDRISANLYRDGQDSVAWHGDTHLRDQPTATVAVVSLGYPRPFKLRPRGGGESLSWRLGQGDLAVMGGTCQRTWQHAVPKVAKAGPRICVMFRTADIG